MKLMAKDDFEDLFSGLSSIKKPNVTKKRPSTQVKADNTHTLSKQNKPSRQVKPQVSRRNTDSNSVHTDEQLSPEDVIRQRIKKQEESNKTNKNSVLPSMNTVIPITQKSNNNKEKISLDKPGMDEIKVTPDGRTLSDMLPHLRGGKNPIDKQLDELKSGKSEVTINGKIKSDNRYTRHNKQVETKKKNANARRKLSTKFIQRNTKYTEEEKIIMTNLGMTGKDLELTMRLPNDKLTKGDKLRILAAGTKGLERYYKGKRFRVSRGDDDIIQFLAKFKLANTRTLSKLRNETQSVTNRRLRRLKKNGLVADSEIPGLGTVWSVTEIGMALSGYELTTYRQRTPKMSVLPPIIGINYVASCLWHNSFNVLFLNDYPANNKTMTGSDGHEWKARGEDLVSELEIRSSYGKELRPNEGSSFGVSVSSQDIVIKNAQILWHKWDKDGRNSVSPEMFPGNEYLWILFPEGGLTVNFHVPDLVINRPRDNDGNPQSIAVECELTRKSHKNYVNTMRAYMEDKYVYKKVLWITNNSAIVRRLQEAAKEIGFTRYDIVPFTNETGIYRNRDIWHI